jgi:hypothetical protein
MGALRRERGSPPPLMVRGKPKEERLWRAALIGANFILTLCH